MVIIWSLYTDKTATCKFSPGYRKLRSTNSRPRSDDSRRHPRAGGDLASGVKRGCFPNYSRLWQTKFAIHLFDQDWMSSLGELARFPISVPPRHMNDFPNAQYLEILDTKERPVHCGSIYRIKRGRFPFSDGKREASPIILSETIQFNAITSKSA